MSQVPQGNVKEIAERIGLAARSLPGVEIGYLVNGLINKLGGQPTPVTLGQITVTDLQKILQPLRDAPTREEIQQAVRYLWGEGQGAENLPSPQPLPAGGLPHSVRLAVASNTSDNLDGHFGSCKRFLIYQVTTSDAYLIELRDPAECASAEDPNAARAEMLADCQLIYVQSIGGPAAAKVIRAGIHPVKFPAAGPAEGAIRQLQKTLQAPPPWLARVMGVKSSLASRFATQDEDA